MIEVKVQKRFKCDFCNRRSTKSAMEKHEPTCYRNPDRVCRNCDNKGFTMQRPLPEYPEIKEDCVYCGKFDKKMLEEIEAREKENKCPKCSSECWRDEHPDGYYVGLSNCSNCDWSEKSPEQTELTNNEIKQLPF